LGKSDEAVEILKKLVRIPSLSVKSRLASIEVLERFGYKQESMSGWHQIAMCENASYSLRFRAIEKIESESIDTKKIWLSISDHENIPSKYMHKTAQALENFGEIEKASRLRLRLGLDDQVSIHQRKLAAYSLEENQRFNYAGSIWLSIGTDSDVRASERIEAAQHLMDTGHQKTAVQIFQGIASDSSLPIYTRVNSAKDLDGKIRRNILKSIWLEIAIDLVGTEPFGICSEVIDTLRQFRKPDPAARICMLILNGSTYSTQERLRAYEKLAEIINHSSLNWRTLKWRNLHNLSEILYLMIDKHPSTAVEIGFNLLSDVLAPHKHKLTAIEVLSTSPEGRDRLSSLLDSAHIPSTLQITVAINLIPYGLVRKPIEYLIKSLLSVNTTTRNLFTILHALCSYALIRDASHQDDQLTNPVVLQRLRYLTDHHKDERIRTLASILIESIIWYL
jgi:hypothetical protein